MDLLALSARVALTQPLSDQPDYGSGDAAVPHGETTSQQEDTSKIVKTPGKGYCVKSEKKNSDWSGGCYPSKGEAEKRLKQVEYFKHQGASLDAVMANCATILSSDAPETEILISFGQLLAAYNDEDTDVQTSQEEQQAKAPPGWKKTVEHMKDHPEIDNPFALSWYMKNKGDKPHKKK